MMTNNTQNNKDLIFVPTDKTSSLFAILKDRRGWTEDFLNEINNPEYPDLKDMDLMISRLQDIQLAQRQIIVVPDFDMDGVTSGVLMYAGLAELGFNVGLYVPDFRRGHDLTPEAIDELKLQFPNSSAIITTDSGVNSHRGTGRAKTLGLEVFITDHHVQLDQKSPADVIINPARIDETYPHTGICGAMVAWQMLMAYAKKYAPQKLRDIRLLVLFAGIGTVSDVMPLLYENRQVVRDAIAIARLLYVPLPPEDSASDYDIEQSILIQLLRSEQHSKPFLDAFEGFAITLRAFREYGPLVTRLDDFGDPLLDDDTGEPIVTRKPGKLRTTDAINEEFFGFYLAPTFNSVRRIEGEMKYAFGVFTAPTQDEKFECAKQMLDYNEERKRYTQEYLEEIQELNQPLAPYVWVTPAPTGMLGLLANTLMSEYGHPVAVIRTEDDPYARRAGSARAPGWFNVISEMTAAGFTTIGHEQACGVQMENWKETERFAKHMQSRSEEIYQKLIDSGEYTLMNQPDIIIGDTFECDGTLNNPDEILDLANAIGEMRPYGNGFPMPEIELILNLSRCAFQTIGEDKTHLRIVTHSGIKVLWWNNAAIVMQLQERAQSTIPGDNIVRLRGRLDVNNFRGNISPQIQINRIVDKNGITIKELE